MVFFVQLTNLENINGDENKTSLSHMEIEELLTDMVKKLLRKGPTYIRIPKRRKILQTLNAYQEDIGMYREQLERFINLEEHFLAEE